MRNRDAVLHILQKHFSQVANAATLDRVAREVSDLTEDWEEVPEKFWAELGNQISVQCADICTLASEMARGAELRIFRRRAG